MEDRLSRLAKLIAPVCVVSRPAGAHARHDAPHRVTLAQHRRSVPDPPGNLAVPVLEGAGRPVRRQGCNVDDGVGAFGDGLRAAVVVEVGAGEAGVGRCSGTTRRRWTR